MSKPFPLGAQLTDDKITGQQGCNFAIHAPDCQQLTLVLFNDSQQRRFVIHDKYRDIHHIFIEDISTGQEYGFMAVIDEKEWLLIDPYAKALSHVPYYQPPYTAEKSWLMSHAVVVDNQFDWQGIEQPQIPLINTVLLETHTKGFSQQNELINTDMCGSYQALAAPENIAFLKQQGITSIQLLPVASCIPEPHLLEQQGTNYWGYNPLVFMAPDPRFAIKNAVYELKTTVRELHRNNLEVILDVVYNHTAEGDKDGPLFNLKALDKKHYLQTESEFKNYTGCGNTLDLTHQATLSLVLDSLRYWVTEYKIDGFRFDLAATVGRQGNQFNPQSSFFQAIAQDPVLKHVKLIAEPWDIGPNGYQLGHFPDGWNECNDKFRDTVRSFWRGDTGYLKDLATRVMGSQHFFSANRWPHKLSINYITYHDGFTLQDLVSYNDKHNQQNGENNRDGHNDNRSYNCGYEGPTDNIAVIALREKQKRNLMATLIFSFGIPHILAADLVSHSQEGNNNAYCQDNKLSWLNWQVSTEKQGFQDWLQAMLIARKQYFLPFIDAFNHNHHHSVTWYTPQGKPMQSDDWDSGSQLSLHMKLNKQGDELILLFNQADHELNFLLPSPNLEPSPKINPSKISNLALDLADNTVQSRPIDNDSRQVWQLLCDSQYSHTPTLSITKSYTVSARSIVVMKKINND